MTKKLAGADNNLMSSASGRASDSSSGQGFAILVALALCCLIVGVLAHSHGRESERRARLPAEYSKSGKADASRACGGGEASVVFECVYERVEASLEQARSEQDLTAQQRAASSSLAAAIVAFLTLVVTSVGVWFVKRTLDATLQAVEDTSAATVAMNEANRIAEDGSQRQLRSYLSVKSVTLDQFMLESEKLKLVIELQNSGQTPATLTAVNFKALWVSSSICSTLLEVKSTKNDIRCHRDTPMQMTFDLESDRAETNSPGNLMVIGKVKYIDVFGKKRKEPFAFQAPQGEAFFVELNNHELPLRLAAFSPMNMLDQLMEEKSSRQSEKT